MLLCETRRETNPGTDALPHAELWFRVHNLDSCTQNKVGSVRSPPWSSHRTTAGETGLFLLQSTQGKHGAWKNRGSEEQAQSCSSYPGFQGTALLTQALCKYPETWEVWIRPERLPSL